MKNRDIIFIKLGLAIVLFICLLDMPYGFFELVRFVSMIVFAVLSYKSFKEEVVSMAIVYGGLALLFQPFFKVSLGREMWGYVDFAVGVLLIGSVIKSKIDERKEKDLSL